ncbi:MAG: ammonia-forming cytochrome c nitrite reductase subunit c552 [Elusimicrobia bacterium]|nr:ammonia-forming cytochrome c nitrite reductase subunit c552 [Elusimicrobiota bacterium]
MSRDVLLPLALAAALAACNPPRSEPVRPVKIAEGEVEPAEWGKAYPLHHESWLETRLPTPAGLSKYKRGGDGGKTFDKLSEYPYLALLFKGWGFGVEYNEPRGHWHMLKDVIAVDPSRIKAGGVCLSCKSPYAPRLEKELGADYYSQPFHEVRGKIPARHQELGAACIDCHTHDDLGLKISREFTLGKALRSIGTDPAQLSRQEMRIAVCAQCHVSYAIPKDRDMHSTGIFFPWQGGRWGRIAIEDIIPHVRATPEWTQAITGFKLGFLRHPEFELFTNGSTHFAAGAACADCHMPYQRVGSSKISDHRIMSPLKNGFKGCVQCHSEDQAWLKERVLATQDRSASLLLRAGYATAGAAKLFEKANAARAGGRGIDASLYEQAKRLYEEAFYRVTFIGAENSLGFHNPAETLRVLGDAAAFALKAEALLRQALARAGVPVPAKVDLESGRYLEGRGEKKVGFEPRLEFKDPFGTQSQF